MERGESAQTSGRRYDWLLTSPLSAELWLDRGHAPGKYGIGNNNRESHGAFVMGFRRQRVKHLHIVARGLYGELSWHLSVMKRNASVEVNYSTLDIGLMLRPHGLMFSEFIHFLTLTSSFRVTTVLQDIGRSPTETPQAPEAC